ncbi:hypothetical protein Patl1_27687 [Pistacia atlantica]|uniref:Uncharacterized protein n=1 Tax=Pistacia atlantica TaxID=434234 RepID=A0ACC1BCQ1_9ROSI|nr:hypothetical protein Patl1_27687 [Pistacia atlantica]
MICFLLLFSDRGEYQHYDLLLAALFLKKKIIINK